MTTYEVAYNASLKYFNGNELAAKVFVDKYALRDNDGNILEETPDEMHRRLAREFARIDKKKFKVPLTEDTIYSYLENFSKIIPQGSPMTAIGNNHQTLSTSNCFVVPAPEDSYGGILLTDQHIVQISKRRGGIGYDISTLRPKGQNVKNAARTTSGAISFMHRFSNSGREVGQGGRRGAQMITISVHHPDILDFIKIKNDEISVTGANISVRLTDEFLTAVKEDKEYQLRWPVESDNPKISSMINAREVWKEIIHSAWLRAEPGILFWDNILGGPADCYPQFKTVSTNPCQPRWAKVLTPKGISKLEDIQIGDIIWSKEGWTEVTNKWSNGIKKVFKYTTTAGVFYGTENHKLVVNNEGLKEPAKIAESVEIISGKSPEWQSIAYNIQDIMDGLVLGDGGIHKASNNLVGLYIGKDDIDYFSSEIKDLIIKHRPGISEEFYTVKTTITVEELPRVFDRRIPERFIKGDTNTVVSFLRGLYSANGSVCGNRITLKSTSKGLIEDVQLMLSSIGIRSYWTVNQEKEVKFENDSYLCKQSYDLNISTDREIFLRCIGFIHKYKNEKIKLVDSNRVKTVYDIIAVEEISEEEVFDITVDNYSHTYWTQGCNVSNCGEITLSAYDSCRLLAINLFSFVKNPFTKNSFFDYKEFYNDVQIAQRLMDNMIDLELEQIDKIINKIESDPESADVKHTELALWKNIRKACEDGRRTGLGITGLGDTLAALNIKYGSEESIKQTELIYKILKFGAYRSSVDMAKELGAFPVWDFSLEKNNKFLNRFKDEQIQLDDDTIISGKDIYDDMKKYGRRNVALLTTAPTGTLSILTNIGPYFNISSGIEPVFMLDFIRRKKINHDDKNVKVDFTDKLGDKWTEFTVYHSGVQYWMDITGNTDIKQSPYFGATAEEIVWTQRVKLQAAAQKHICHSISSTVNLPENVSEEEVAKIYEMAWQSGCKGMTVYRKNCRTGVLIEKKEESVVVNDKRPKELPCEVHHLTVKGKPYFCLVGIQHDKPYEVFAGKNGFLDKKIKTGTIIKTKKGYKAVFDDESEINPINMSCDEHEDALTRLTSILLRNNVSIISIIEQLDKTHGDLTSFAKCISRSLKKYIPSNTKTGEKCPECQQELVYQEGCKKCSCGWAKCG